MLIAEPNFTALWGCFGLHKTVSVLFARVYWPGIIATIKDFARGCAMCQAVKDINALL